MLTGVNSKHIRDITMSIINTLFKKKRPIETTVWGIRVPRGVKTQWQMLSAIMRVPCNRLILFVLDDWAKANTESIVNKEARDRLSERIARVQLNSRP